MPRAMVLDAFAAILRKLGEFASPSAALRKIRDFFRQRPSIRKFRAQTPGHELLTLPREIRDLIYQQIIDSELLDDDPDLFVCPRGVPDGTISIRNRSSRRDQTSCGRSGIIDLMRTSKQVHNEVEEVLFLQYRFKLYPFDDAMRFLKRIGEHQRQMIRNVTVELDSYVFLRVMAGATFESKVPWKGIEQPRLISSMLPGLQSVVCEVLLEEIPSTVDTEGRDLFNVVEPLVYQADAFKGVRRLSLEGISPEIIDEIKQKLEESRLHESTLGESLISGPRRPERHERRKYRRCGWLNLRTPRPYEIAAE